MILLKASGLPQGIKNANVIADKAYGANALIAQLEKQNCTVVIPPKSNKKY